MLFKSILSLSPLSLFWLWLLVPACDAQNLTYLLTNPANDWSANTTISFPGQTEFVNVTARWNTFDAPTYFAAISPGTEEDLIKAMELATKNGINFLATGGRHGFNPTLGQVQNGLAIDLGKFDMLEVDAEAGTITVGPAIRMSDVLDPVYDAGYEIQVGTCTCPAFIGATLGAGIGRWVGIYGLLIDALESVRFVAANGSVFTVNQYSQPELFWGIRGAGANFGIITQATYKISKISSQNGGGQALTVDFVFPAEKSLAYFQALEDLGTMPANLAVITLVLYNETTSSAGILTNWMYFGPEDEGLALMAPIFDLQPSVASPSVVPWTELLYTQGFGIDDFLCEDGLVRDIYTANIRHITASTWQAAFEKMVTFYDGYPEARSLSYLELETFPNQAALAVPDDEMAYPWRDAIGYLAFQFGWTEENSTVINASAALGAELRDMFVATSGYPGLSVYVNYAHGDEPLESIYGADKLPRLAALKRTWDPNNVFANHLALPTEYPELPAW